MATQATTSTTNLDVGSIVSQLMTVERQPINKLNTKEASYQGQLSAYGSIKGAVSSFQTALQGLNNVSKFQALKATPSETGIFTASAVSTAVAGSYSVEVSSLAKAQSLISAGQTAADTAIGAGGSTTISFDLGTISGGNFTAYDSAAGTGGTYANANFASSGGDIKTITIDSSNNTLAGIRDAINAAKMGVSATIVNDGSDTPYRLALTSSSLGVTNSIKIGVSGDSEIASLIAHDPAGTQALNETVTASNANLKVNGVAVSKTSNSVADVIQGVTLTLGKTTAVDTPVTLTVARDTTTLTASLNSFVKAYNDLSGIMKSLSAYDATTQRGAILQGDSTVRTMQNQLRGMMSAAVGDSSSTLRSLSDVGIGFQLDGSLAINQSRLDNAINNHFDEIATLFTGTNGYVSTLNGWATSALGPDGMLAGRTEGISKTIDDLGKRRAAIETRLLSVEKRYRAQFTALDSMLSSMNQTSVYLSQQLSALNTGA